MTTAAAYRRDIDGLRAVAVLAVLVHHLAPGLLPGGFVGVDLFFVISGYLISGQILAEIRDGRFSLGGFYRRRVNRILPALLLVVAASLLAGWWLLTPADLQRLLDSAAAASLGLSNLYFWIEYGSYFARPTGEAVLLHTWSLGIEEQFYLLWPWALLGLARLPDRRLRVLLPAAALLAVAASQALAVQFASAAYFLLPARAFELLLGAVLVLLPRPVQPLAAWPARALTLTGAALIAWALLRLSPGARFPGLNALLPCLGAALLIAAGHLGRPAALLSTPVLVWPGRRSYAIYLWHWPLIAYLHYLDIAIDPLVGAAVVLATVLLAAASWRWVEQPLRRNGGRLPVRRVLLRRFALPAALLLGGAALGQAQQGFPGRFDPRVQRYEAAQAQRPDLLRHDCHVPSQRYRSEPQPQRCRLGVDKPAPDGLLVGDSFANHWSGLVDVMARHEGLALSDYTMDACTPLLAAPAPGSAQDAVRCDGRNRRLLDWVREHRVRLVVLGGRWPTEPLERLPALEDFVAALVAAGATPVVILRNQSLGSRASCPIRQFILDRRQDCSVAADPLPPYWARLQQRFPQLRLIDPNRFICDQGRCSAVRGDLLLYRDGGHLNEPGSRELGRLMIAAGERLAR